MKIGGRIVFFFFLSVMLYAVVTRIVWPLVQFHTVHRSSDGKKEMSSARQTTNKTLEQAIDGLKTFVYLVQTPRCLPLYFLDEKQLGNETLCDCHVLVLSFEERCQFSSQLSHIQHEHRKNISWTKGRNLLLQLAKGKQINYQYFIFLDDDIRFTFNEFTPEKIKLSTPLRAFETFLKEYEPAIGVTDYEIHHGAGVMVSKRKHLCKNAGPEKLLYLPTVHFDASFNAFHHKALRFLLPYITKYDNQCWWHAQRYLIAKAEILFRGQSVLFTPVHTSNPVHSNYPKDKKDSQQIWSSIVKNITKEIPLQYRNKGILREFKEDPKFYTENSLSICLDLPAHTPIVPFQHFNWNFG